MHPFLLQLLTISPYIYPYTNEELGAPNFIFYVSEELSRTQ